MNKEPYYGCAGGCRGCPRRRQCFSAVPAMAPAPTDSGTAWEPTHEATELQQFLAENGEQGALRIQAFRGDQALPLPGVHITVSKVLDGHEHIFFEGSTDGSGLIEDVRLPAPPRSGSQRPGGLDPYATYRLQAEYADFLPLDTTVDIFQGVKTIQPVQLRLRLG